MKNRSFLSHALCDPQIRHEARKLVMRDRCTYIRSLTTKQLSNAMHLDLPCQSLLRFSSEYDSAQVEGWIDEFLHVPDTRWALAQDVLRHYANEECADAGKEIDSGSASVAPGHVYRGAQQSDGSTVFARLFEQANEVYVDRVIYFATPHGFAAFDPEHVTHDGRTRSQVVDGCSYSSTGGLMYFGFNIPGTGSFLQRHPIEILARTFVSLAKNERRSSGGSLNDWMIHSELLDYRKARGGSFEITLKDTLQFLDSHETGHDLNTEGNYRLRAALDVTKTSHDAFYTVDFPSEKDLSAWTRVRTGQGTARDILFLLGDLLANMAILESHHCCAWLHLLRAFNWWLLREPKTGMRPRGIACFLAQSYFFDPEPFYRDIEEILHVANVDPTYLPTCLFAFERKGWDALKRYVEISNVLSTI